VAGRERVLDQRDRLGVDASAALLPERFDDPRPVTGERIEELGPDGVGELPVVGLVDARADPRREVDDPVEVDRVEGHVRYWGRSGQKTTLPCHRITYKVYAPYISVRHIRLYIPARMENMRMLVQSRCCPGCEATVDVDPDGVTEVTACPECGYVPRQGAD